MYQNHIHVTVLHHNVNKL